MSDINELNGEWQSFLKRYFCERQLIIAANRGPVTFQTNADGSRTFDRGSGGLVTALLGVARHVESTWIACARTDADVEWAQGKIPMRGKSSPMQIFFLAPPEETYEQYYNVIANPLLWFLQHGMWDISREPIINRTTWAAWREGYVAINQLFADKIAAQCRDSKRKPLVMLQDYHLYLAPRMLREQLPPSECPSMMHFVHIPWPGPDYWSILPDRMRRAILEGMLSSDLIGFQTQQDASNFARTCRRYLQEVRIDLHNGQICSGNHVTYVRAFPIAIDVDSLRRVATSAETRLARQQIEEIVGDRQLILRVERIEPSKNILRGFEAYSELLELHPELREKVVFIAILVPSRLGLDQYQGYLDEVMAAIGRVNATFGTGAWEPIRAIIGENYERAVAAMQCYDVLLVNSIADGMNLVAKEGPVINEFNGRLVLSERTGAREQLEEAALVIPPCDVSATAAAIYEALTMPEDEARWRADMLSQLVEKQDIVWWFRQQLQTAAKLGL